MLARTLLAVAALACALFATATPAAASQTQSCQLTVSDFYMSIAMQTSSAGLYGCSSERIDGIEMEWAATPGGPFTVTYPADYMSVSSDGKRATAYFLDPEQRGYCRAKATAGALTAYSPNTVSC
ncbi:hypothetical protein [Allorhizocola rhizosphaerae]|uniref:hypothetical protein n=1 Tax=Allorhizocola rhizosphaerae TaxID=1872709 RepID=UPI000E3CC2C5|nr:hypothetical protein [Allorhizocola rhizosphaerae]